MGQIRQRLANIVRLDDETQMVEGLLGHSVDECVLPGIFRSVIKCNDRSRNDLFSRRGKSGSRE
jgi:hypothetical protein